MRPSSLEDIQPLGRRWKATCLCVRKKRPRVILPMLDVRIPGLGGNFEQTKHGLLQQAADGAQFRQTLNLRLLDHVLPIDCFVDPLDTLTSWGLASC